MVDSWFHSECGLQIKKVTAIDERVVSPWYQDGIRVVPGWYQSGTRMVSEWYQGGIRVVRGTALY